MRVKIIILVLAIIFTSLVAYFYFAAKQHLKYLATFEDMLGLILAVGDLNDEDLVSFKNDETLFWHKVNLAMNERHPDIAMVNNTILDAWGNPVEVQLSEATETITMTVKSPGPDGIFGNFDDYEVSRNLFKHVDDE